MTIKYLQAVLTLHSHLCCLSTVWVQHTGVVPTLVGWGLFPATAKMHCSPRITKLQEHCLSSALVISRRTTLHLIRYNQSGFNNALYTYLLMVLSKLVICLFVQWHTLYRFLLVVMSASDTWSREGILVTQWQNRFQTVTQKVVLQLGSAVPQKTTYAQI